MSARFSQSHGIVPVVAPLVLNYDTGMTMDSVNMGKYNHGTLIIIGSADVAGTGVLTMMAGHAAAEVDAAITFEYRTIAVDIAAAALSDVLSTPVTSAALTLVAANLVSGMYVIEWDVEDMSAAIANANWITPVLNADGTAGMISAVIILSEPRYERDVMMTATV